MNDINILVPNDTKFVFETPTERYVIRTGIKMSEDESSSEEPEPQPVDPRLLELYPSTVPIPLNTEPDIQTIADGTKLIKLQPMLEDFNGGVNTYYLECNGDNRSETQRTPYTDDLRCTPNKLHVVFYKSADGNTLQYAAFVPASNTLFMMLPFMGEADGTYYVYIGNYNNSSYFLTDTPGQQYLQRKIALVLYNETIQQINTEDDLIVYKWENPTLNILPTN